MRFVLGLLALLSANPAFAGGCDKMANYYEGVWLDKSTPTAEYVLSMPDLNKGATGCYWIAATPQWGINSDLTHVARVENPNLDGGILISVGLTMDDLNGNNHAWVWIKSDGLSPTRFSEMWFNQHTRGIER